MTILIGSLTIGLILSLLSLGIFISFRIYNFPDITAEGSFAFGGAIGATLLVFNFNPFLATFIAFCGGAVAGMTTGILHTRFKINELLSGILVMTALYSINLHVMGKSNVPLLTETSLITYIESFAVFLFAGNESVNIAGWSVLASDFTVLIASLVFIVVVGLAMYFFFKTNLGTAMRATGNNSQMIRALGVNTNVMIIFGIALSNGMIALSGALLAQYQGFADVQMGIGMLVWGIASLIIGESLIGVRSVGFVITGTIIGAILFRLLVAIALRWGMDPNDLKLITAVFVFCALILPNLMNKFRNKKGKTANA